MRNTERERCWEKVEREIDGDITGGEDNGGGELEQRHNNGAKSERKESQI